MNSRVSVMHGIERIVLLFLFSNGRKIDVFINSDLCFRYSYIAIFNSVFLK